MRSDSGDADCLGSAADLQVLDRQNDVGKTNSRRAAVNSARLHKVACEQILPRLAFLHKEHKRPEAAAPPTSAEINEFAEAVLRPEPAPADEFFHRVSERGLTIDALINTLLEPTARRLGEMWAEDICDFLDVTIGVNRLRLILEAQASALETCACSPALLEDSRRRALLVATPREQHRFGLDVIATSLRASGWETTLEVRRSAQENGVTAAASWFAVAGVTIGDSLRLADAAQAIRAIRRTSLNPSIVVIVGGIAVRDRPDLVVRVGADAMAEDGPASVLLAESLYR